MTAQSFFLHPGDTRILPQLLKFLGLLPTDKGWQVEIKRITKRRSNNQNAALFGVAYPPLMEFMGLRGESDRQQLHAELCCQYFGAIETTMGFRKPRRTTTVNERGEKAVLTIAEFSAFYAFVQQTAAELGCFIPDPDPLHGAQQGEVA